MFMTKTKTHNENKVDFKKKTYGELQELLERQNKILNNKRIVDILSDKGEKVKLLRDELEVELNKRRVHEKLCKDMSLLKIGQDQLDALEWNDKNLPLHTVQKNNQYNIDEHDEDVLKMFVSHSGVYQDKIIIKEKPEESLIKPSDLIDEEPIVKDIQKNTEIIEFPENVERYAKNLCGRIDTHLPTDKRHLLLNKPAKPNKHSTIKAEVVSLKESVMLQYAHENKLKELQEDRLKQRSILKFDTSCYRESKLLNIDDSEEDSDIEDGIIDNDEN